MKTTTNNHFTARDFSRKTVNALSRAGIQIIGTCVIPGEGELAYAKGSRGYQLNDNGCMRIRSYLEVKAIAGV